MKYSFKYLTIAALYPTTICEGEHIEIPDDAPPLQAVAAYWSSIPWYALDRPDSHILKGYTEMLYPDCSQEDFLKEILRGIDVWIEDEKSPKMLLLVEHAQVRMLHEKLKAAAYIENLVLFISLSTQASRRGYYLKRVLVGQTKDAEQYSMAISSNSYDFAA